MECGKCYNLRRKQEPIPEQKKMLLDESTEDRERRLGQRRSIVLGETRYKRAGGDGIATRRGV